MLLCQQTRQWQSQSWTGAFADALDTEVCIEIKSGIQITGERVHEIWTAASPGSPRGAENIVPYKGGFSLRSMFSF